MTEYSLKQLQELRLEANKDKDVFVTLLEGSAEIFGAELQLGSKVSLRGNALAVFTWHGCKLAIEGEPDFVYVAEDTPNVSYINCHQVLHNLRQEAQASGGQGPRVVVAGPTDSGKSSMCRMLLNWAVRAQHQPTYVDLDIGQGSITVPGCLAATPVEAPITIEEGYPTQAELLLLLLLLPQYLVDKLCSVLDSRASSSPEVAAAGMVVNTMGCVDGLGYELLLHAIKSLKADVVLVMEQDRLFTQLTNQLKSEVGAMGKTVSVVKLYKSGGVAQRSSSARQQARAARIKEYFYGPDGGLQPVSVDLDATNMRVFRSGTGPRPPSSALPLGQARAANPLKVTPVVVSPELEQSLLAVSHAQVPDQLLPSNVAGFVWINGVDVTSNKVTCLMPTSAAMPGSYLLTGTIKTFVQ
uniref:Protein CLP1 homolog n=1 Tax=Tetradesmus obliquus TaxID=3088 RepID=A0A383VI97_TETOB|eukprot:jgi/Sobl393_1/7592/SZX64472.1